MRYFVYIIESQTTGLFYYGSSDDVVQRVADHNANRSKYTRFKGPWKLIFKREFSNKTEALRFEIYLKKTRNMAYIRKQFDQFFIP